MGSDSSDLRQHVLHTYKEEAMMVGLRPTHPRQRHVGQSMQNRTFDSAQMDAFAEMLILAEGDHFALSPIYKGKMATHGRQSAFASYAMAAGMQDLFYNAYTCQLRRKDHSEPFGKLSQNCNCDECHKRSRLYLDLESDP